MECYMYRSFKYSNLDKKFLWCNFVFTINIFLKKIVALFKEENALLILANLKWVAPWLGLFLHIQGIKLVQIPHFKYYDTLFHFIKYPYSQQCGSGNVFSYPHGTKYDNFQQKNMCWIQYSYGMSQTSTLKFVFYKLFGNSATR